MSRLQRRLRAIGDIGDLGAGQEKTVIATGNIGCIEQLASGTQIPVRRPADRRNRFDM